MVKTPRDNTRALCEEIIWWHNQLYGWDITLQEVRSKTRLAPVVACRADCMRRIREARGWTYSYIGRWFGGFDHSTVSHHMAKDRPVARPIKNAEGLTITQLRDKANADYWRKKLMNTKKLREAVGTSSTEEHTHEMA